MAHLDGLDLGRKRLSHKDRLIKVLEGDFLRSLTLFGQITGKYHHGWWMHSQQHPLVKPISYRFGLGLSDLQALISTEVFDLTLHVIELTDGYSGRS